MGAQFSDVVVDDAEATEAFTQAMIADPGLYPDLSVPTAYSLTRDQRDRIALAGLRRRYSELRGKISVLDRMGADQGVNEIDDIQTAAYLLFPHTVYKSYPLSLIERNQFDKLTRWMQGLTVVDLGDFSGRDVDSIDDWITALNDRLGLQLVHTSGTTGKISFLPRLASDEKRRLMITANIARDWNGPGSGPDLFAAPRPVIYPSYRSGASAMYRSLDVMAELIARDESNVLTLYPDYFSADVASLAGRLRTAEERGEQGKLQLSPSLLARRDEFVRRDRERAQRLESFFAETRDRFAGQDVMVFGLTPMIFDWAEDGLKRGMRGLFGPNSLLMNGGGSKGRELPANAQEIISEFLGFDHVISGYGMSELTGPSRACEHGHYHLAPYIVPYVLDQDSGEPLPRSGRQTGRFGFVDLFPGDHWGGFLSGDKVTVGGWDEPCACGRTGPYIESPIQRFSELQGGDDKISCAGAPAAHDKAIEFLANMAR